MTHQQAGAHIHILGAGLMGRLLALALMERGHALTLHEAAPDETQARQRMAAHVAAAMLAPLAESAIAPPLVVRMGRYSLGRWPELLAGLPAPVFFQQNGTLVLWHRQDAPEAERLLRRLHKNSASHPGLPPPQALGHAALRACEPGLAAHFTRAAVLPGEGQLDNRQLLDALHSALHTTHMAAKVRWQWGVARSADDFPGRCSPGAPWVLDCRGLGARADCPGLRGVRGEVLRVHAPEVTLARPVRLIHPRYPIYIAPKENHQFVIGATEIETQDESPMSVRSALELLSAAWSVHPGFSEARIVELSARCRPALPDNLPLLRWHAPRVLQINGLYRHGFLLAPALRDVVLELLAGGESPLAQQFGLDAPPPP